MKSLSIVAVAVLVVAGLAFSKVEPAQSSRTTLADLAWLEGSWGGDALGGHCEEIWSPPAGGSMMGMFRLVSKDKTSLFEFLVFEETSAGVNLHFKHFDPDLKPWEEGEVLTLKLDHATDRSWTFLSPDPAQSPSRMVYSRPDDDQMIVSVETQQEGREPVSFDVILKRGE